MIYPLLISGFFFICWIVIIQIISDYPFSLKEIVFVFISVLIPLIFYQIPFSYGIKSIVYVLPMIFLLIAIVYRQKYHLTLLMGLSVIGVLYNPVISKVAGEEFIKQSPNIIGRKDGLYDPILIGMMGGLVFFFLENIVYIVYGSGTQTIILRSIVTALVHLVTGGLIGYSFIQQKRTQIIGLLFGAGIHTLFNMYISNFSYSFLVILILLFFILIGYLLQLSSRLYLVKIT